MIYFHNFRFLRFMILYLFDFHRIFSTLYLSKNPSIILKNFPNNKHSSMVDKFLVDSKKSSV